MNPATIALVIGLVEEAIKVTPGLVADLQTLFAKPNPTPEDWQALRNRVQNASYADLVPNSDLATAMDAGRVTAEHLASAPFPAMVDPILPVTDQAPASDPSPVTLPEVVTPAQSPASEPVTNQAASDAAPVTEPGPVTADPSPAPAVPWSAASVFAQATMRYEKVA